MATSLRGKVTLVTPRGIVSGDGGTVGPIDYLSWSGGPKQLRWDIDIAAGGEYLICQAHWQPSSSTPRSQAGVFWTTEGGYSLAAFQPLWIDDGGNDGVRIFTQHMLSMGYGPLVPFDPPTVELHFDPDGDISEFEGWVWHIPATSIAEIPGYDVWRSTTAYDSGDSIVAAGHLWQALGSGTTGGSEPSWPGGFGGTISDGTITWSDLGTRP